jgi:hypothetical protein
MESTNANVFKFYAQKENNFTNGLFSLLQLSVYEKPRFIQSFLKDLLSLELNGECEFCIQVLRNIDLADAELCWNGHCIRFETKIVSGTLRDDQIGRHLEIMLKRPEKLKILVLLTPDDGNSNYIEQFRNTYKPEVVHLGWKNVYDYLETAIKNSKQSVFSKLVHQFLEHIREDVFKQDYAGIIQKVAFGKVAGVFHETWLKEIKEWGKWDTPKEYKQLGKGRKLLLYDGIKKEIPIEVEILSVIKTQQDDNFPWTNSFDPHTIHMIHPPIPLERILKIPGFKNFNKSRGSHRNITQEEYRQLTENDPNDGN